jgi:Carbohydrate binding domain
MKIYLHSKFNRLVTILITLAFSIFFIRCILLSWFSRIDVLGATEQGIEKAISLTPDNPDNYLLLATYLNLDFTEDTAPILSLYKKALELVPFNYNYWFSLSEFLKDKGYDDRAVYALRIATNMAPGIVSLRWNAGLLALELNRRDMVISNFRKVISSDPARRKLAFAALSQYMSDADDIFDTIPEEFLPSYLAFLMNTNKLYESKVVFDKLKSQGDVPDSLFLDYVNFTIDKRDILFAKELWSGRYGNWNGLWNGSFEDEPLNRGFDWRLDKHAAGAEILRVKSGYDGSYSMEVKFDGTENLDFGHVEQIIPVEPNHGYSLSSYMKTEGITTKNGIQWEMYCLGTYGPASRSEPLIGTQNWKLVTLSFTTPSDCHAVELRLRRYKSDKLDRFISGKVWVDKVVLKESYLN